ncbi:nitrilase [Campylobacterota bacterium]|nr:nitrilase [Campylobacterota bacterium]
MNTRNAKTVEIALLQTATLSIDSAKLDYLLAQAKHRGATLAVLPEYVCNLFFKELESMPFAFVQAQGEKQYENLRKLASQYNMTVIAPLVRAQGGKIYKSIYRFSHDRTSRYDQRVFMDYAHWNEADYFESSKRRDRPAIFNYHGFRIGLLAGFELHFDLLWQQLIARKVDCVIVPTASTFESFARWQTLLKSRSFTGGCYALRANRIGTYNDRSGAWEFYGNSLVCNPFGEIENALEDHEGMLIATLERSLITEARRAFGFSRIVASRLS